MISPATSCQDPFYDNISYSYIYTKQTHSSPRTQFIPISISFVVTTPQRIATYRSYTSIQGKTIHSTDSPSKSLHWSKLVARRARGTEQWLSNPSALSHFLTSRSRRWTNAATAQIAVYGNKTISSELYHEHRVSRWPQEFANNRAISI